MPDVPLDAKHKVASVFDLDLFRLDKNEKARITILDKTAKMMLAHYVRSGEPREDGSIPGRYYACLGEYDKVMEDGGDPDNCPACHAAEPGRDVTVSTPRRRFAMHVIRYRTNTKGQATLPLSLALEVWQFGDDKFNKLVDRQEEHGDLRKRDINITCTAKQYQNMDLDVSAKMLVATHDGAIEQYQELKKTRSSELDRLLCLTITHDALERLVGEATPAIKDQDIEAEADSTLADVIEDIASETATEGEAEAKGEAKAEPDAAADLPQEAAQSSSFADLLDAD